LLEKLTELKTKEDFLPFIPQKIDKQLVLDLRAKHMNLNSTNCLSALLKLRVSVVLVDA
jgi:hypothetical protein